MQIPPLKKSTFYGIVAIVLLAGIVLGALFFSYIFSKNIEKICLLSQPVEVNTDLTENQIQTAVSLDLNKMMSGKVVSKEAVSFTLQVSVTNPLDVGNSVVTTVKVPFDATKDEVVIAKQDIKTSTVETVKASFSDIKIGGTVLLKILNGKKTVYLSST